MTSNKLLSLKTLIRRLALDVYIVPSGDAHSSEYTQSSDARRHYLTDFSGSSGTALVSSADDGKNFLATDGRYFNQAGKELNPKDWTLLKQRATDEHWRKQLRYLFGSSIRVGIDPKLIGIKDAQLLQAELKQSASELVAVPDNLIDKVWAYKPDRIAAPIYVYPIEFSGQSTRDKIEHLGHKLKVAGHSHFVVTMLDQIAWLFNLRGSDIEYNPVFRSYAIIKEGEPGEFTAQMFINSCQLSEKVISRLSAEGVFLKDYEDFFEALSSLNLESQRIALTPNASWAVHSAIRCGRIDIVDSPISLSKAIKNSTELEGMKECHIRDGVAIVEYFSWLESALKSDQCLSEYEGSRKLSEFRAKQSLYKGDSFEAVSSSGQNAAVIHYAPSSTKSSTIELNSIYLCDSGGQYLDGTTDVTRTWHFGTPTKDEIDAYTRVLKGHIALEMAIFPEGTTGHQLDSLARASLWQIGKDYNHGTGHGVGSFLNCHEGPCSISQALREQPPLHAGMVLSNEPGYYEDGKFGIRIESMMFVKAKAFDGSGDKFLAFESLTLCPMDRNLIDVSMMSKDEITWLNDYHSRVLDTIKPLLFANEPAQIWLQRRCEMI